MSSLIHVTLKCVELDQSWPHSVQLNQSWHQTCQFQPGDLEEAWVSNLVPLKLDAIKLDHYLDESWHQSRETQSTILEC